MISFLKKYNKSIFTLVIFLIGLSSWSQNILISQGGTVNVSGGEIFYDAGGSAGNDGNTNYTITLCPSNPGEKVCLNFSYFKTYFSGSGEDALFIYDGNTVTLGTDIGKLMGDYSIDVSNATTPYGAGIEPDGTLSAVYSPTIFCATSSTGCLTLTFVNGNASQQPGWVANVTTYKDLPAPGCNIDITSDKTSICNGENVQLTVTGDIVAAAINNNFNGSLGTGWQGTASATIVNTVCAAPSLDNSQYLWMQSSPGPRSLTSNSFNLANGGTISFEHRQAKFNSDPSPCEAPDINFSGTRNEGIYLQYSTDNGTNWTTFKFLFSNSQFSNSGTADSYNNGCGDYVHRWTKMTYPIPDAAKTPNTLFRWHQQRVTSASTDNWGLDNVVIASPLASTVTVRNLTAGGIVIGTSTTTPYTLNVTPTVTTTYEVTISNGVTSCTDQVTVTVGAGIAANAGVDINQCNNASFTMAANTPIAPTTGSWSVISGSVSPATSSNPNQVFVLTGTTATLRWNFDGVCDSSDDVIISNNSLLPAPSVGAVTQPTCATATGSFQITGYNAANTYTFTPSVVSISGTGLVTANAGTYTFTVTNASGCISSESANIVVNAQPTTPAAPTVGAVTQPTCATATGSFQITGYNVANTYTFTPIVVSISGTGLVTANAGTYTFTVTNASGCISSASANIVVNAQPTTPAAPTVGAVTQPTCATATGSFQITGYNAANTYTFTPSVVSISGTGLVTANAGTYTFTVTNASGCTSSASANIVVNAQPSSLTLAYTVTNTICDGSALDFVLSSNLPNTSYSWSATISNITGSYSTTTNGDETNINQIATLTNPENIGTITMIIIPRANGCDGIPSNPITITVNPNPVIESVTVSDSSVCSATNSTNNVHVDIVGNISGITYTWTAITNGVTVVGGVTSGTITATSTTAAFDLQVITSNPLVAGTIYFEVSSVRNGCPGNTIQSGVVTVNPNPGLPISSPIKTICSGENTDLIVDVSPLIAGTELTWEVLTVVNVSGANPGTGTAPVTINDALTATTNTQGYVIYRVRSSLGECQGGYTDYRVNVNPTPLPVLTDGNICITADGQVYQTYTLNTGLNDADYDFEWFDTNGNIIAGATSSTLVVDEAGTYSVIATNWLTGCSSDPLLASATATVTETLPATSMTVIQSEYFSDNATITVNVTGGSGTLMYSLDEGTLQASNVFTNVSAGPHTITVIDTQGCTFLTYDVFVIGYPQYFTPNGDGYNDTWFITGLQDTDVIFIFDRYGKLIKQLKGEEKWDGTYNQEQLPSTDYWFTIDYDENATKKQFKAHFSLKR